MKKLAFVLAITLVLGGALVAHAKDSVPFTDATAVNLKMLLPPPPANDSAIAKAELAELIRIQNTRTAAESASAIADNKISVWRFAGVVNNPNFTKEVLPLVADLFGRLAATARAVVDPAKDAWSRLRPYFADSRVRPLLEKSKSGSYPSRHSTSGTLMGIVLANMLPELRGAIMARAAEFAHNRMVAGMHYATDVEAGKLAGTAIAAVIETTPEFQKEFDSAKTELRAALGYQ